MMSKRLFDLVFSTIGLILLAPLFVVIALWVKVDSCGPVFFRQVRVGQYGRPFRVHKFRTMQERQEISQLQITVGGDSRITHSGAFLRKYKIDELPQLIDVFVGDMSIVGPRPEVPKYIALYPEGVRDIVLSVKPGITDRASLEFRHENEILAAASDPEDQYIKKILPAKQAYYIDYVKNRSLTKDIRIILQTFYLLFIRRH